MSEIPEDVRKTVERAMFALLNQPEDGTPMPRFEQVLALAILDERERCAQIAENTLIGAQEPWEPWEHASPSDCLAHAGTTARQVIAIAIRGREVDQDGPY